MQTVGIREFKAHLSRYLRAVQAGQRVVVTDRGRAVAEIGPPAPQATSYEREILALGGTLAAGPMRLEPAGPRPGDWRPVDVVGLLDEQRGER